MRRWLRTFGFGLMIVTLLVALILLLPVLLPAAMAAEALTMRRLARSRCVACGAAIGLAEIRRARIEARAKGHDAVGAMLALGLKPRVVVAWDVRCPTCGRAYEYRPGAAQRPELVAKS